MSKELKEAVKKENGRKLKSLHVLLDENLFLEAKRLFNFHGGMSHTVTEALKLYIASMSKIRANKLPKEKP